MQLCLARPGADGGGAHAPVRSPSLNVAALSSSSSMLRGLRLERDHSPRAVGERVGAEVPLVRSDVEDEGAA